MHNRPEDTGSRTVADAASYERWRSRGEDHGYEDDAPRRSRSRADRCRCHSASEEPCDYCTREYEQGEPVECEACKGDGEVCPTCTLRDRACKCPDPPFETTPDDQWPRLVDCAECEGKGWTEYPG
jgi:hypothetical protein